VCCFTCQSTRVRKVGELSNRASPVVERVMSSRVEVTRQLVLIADRSLVGKSHGCCLHSRTESASKPLAL
jgi:hypothetical protein